MLNLDIQELIHWEPKKLDSYIRRYLTKIKSETTSNLNFKINYNNLETIKIQIDPNSIVNRINYLFNEFYKQIELFTKTTIHSEFTKYSKHKELLSVELKSFVLYYPELFQRVCFQFPHKFNYKCKDF